MDPAKRILGVAASERVFVALHKPRATASLVLQAPT